MRKPDKIRACPVCGRVPKVECGNGEFPFSLECHLDMGTLYHTIHAHGNTA